MNGDFSSDTDNYAERTVRNFIDSDSTLIIVPIWPLPKKIKDGTLLTIEAVKINNKPYLVVDLSKISSNSFPEIDCWVNEHQIRTLNVAGPRESNSPGIYELSIKLIEDVISCIATKNRDNREPMNFCIPCCCPIRDLSS